MNNAATDTQQGALAGSSSSETKPKIVVGLDGSASSDAALRHAARLATALDASLEGVAAWTYPIALSPYPVTTLPSFEDAARETAREAADRVFGTRWPDWFTIVVAEGNSAQVLIAQSEGSELLVVGSRGHGGFAGLLLGSVSAECAAHAKCAVLVAREPVAS
ncbi:universal stress protein [Rathayibacter soli]|uniref:universal stress protein n=1 Tax=Rathayibacter soli TaxID=3144168 RepID=UPI0027E51931|nr:universal stress protein [Glaciibacter superstes]